MEGRTDAQDLFQGPPALQEDKWFTVFTIQKQRLPYQPRDSSSHDPDTHQVQ